MSTQSESAKIQGPHLRAAIADLPLKGQYLSRENLQGEEPLSAISAVANELHSLPHRLDVVEGAVSEFKNGYSDQLRTGIYSAVSDIQRHYKMAEELLFAYLKDQQEAQS